MAVSDDLISRQDAIEAIEQMQMPIMRSEDIGEQFVFRGMSEALNGIKELPSAQTEEAVPHRNYKYLSDFWCECGNHLGKKGDVKYCSDCGKKVKWDE